VKAYRKEGKEWAIFFDDMMRQLKKSAGDEDLSHRAKVLAQKMMLAPFPAANLHYLLDDIEEEKEEVCIGALYYIFVEPS